MIWVAEIGSMHNGNPSLAYELIRQAKWSGATICKFQFGWNMSTQLKYVDDFDERRYVDEWADDLKAWCDHFDIELMASIWSMEGLETARRIGMKRYKIAHQVDDELLTDAVYDAAETVFHSFGETSAIRPSTRNGKAVGVHTTYDYPTTHTAPLAEITDRLSDNRWFGTGYSSHMHGIADALVAVARGATYIEKHLTMNKTMPWPRDASFALLPGEFKQMVELGNEMAALL